MPKLPFTRRNIALCIIGDVALCIIGAALAVAVVIEWLT